MIETPKYYEKSNIEIPSTVDTDFLNNVKIQEIDGKEYLLLNKEQLEKIIEIISEGNYAIEQANLMQDRLNNMIEIANEQQIKIMVTQRMAENLRQIALIEEQLKDEYKKEVYIEKGKSVLITIFSLVSLAIVAL